MPHRESGLSVLVAEDSDEDFDTLREAMALMPLNHALRRAATGDQCLEILRSQSPHPTLLLLDLNMPGIDGRDALRQIRAASALDTMPVIVLSTSANPRDVDFCYAEGANAYHVKPVQYPDHLAVLVATLDYWLGRVTTSKGASP
jgi:CheY-like chemotaxis protein